MTEVKDRILEGKGLGPDVLIRDAFQLHYGSLDVGEEAFKGLEESLLEGKEKGQKVTLKVWRTPEGDILIDGHHRLQFCHKYSIPYEVEVDEKAVDQDSAIERIIFHQRAKGRERTQNHKDYDIKELARIRNKRLLIGQEGGQERNPATGEFATDKAQKGLNGETNPSRKEIAKEQNITEKQVKDAITTGKAIDSIKEEVGSEAAATVLGSNLSRKKVRGIAALSQEDDEIKEELKNDPKSIVDVANREIRELSKEFRNNVKEALKDYPGDFSIIVGYVAQHSSETKSGSGGDHYDFRTTLSGIKGGSKDIMIGQACIDGFCSGKLTFDDAFSLAHMVIIGKYQESTPFKKYMADKNLKRLVFIVCKEGDSLDVIKEKIKEGIAEDERQKELERSQKPIYSKEYEELKAEWILQANAKSKVGAQETIWMHLSSLLDDLECPNCKDKDGNPKKAVDCLQWKCTGKKVSYESELRKIRKQLKEMLEISSSISEKMRKLDEKINGEV